MQVLTHRKKCDEIHPICGKCQRKGDVCTWPPKDKNETKSARDEALKNVRSSKHRRRAKLYALEPSSSVLSSIPQQADASEDSETLAEKEDVSVDLALDDFFFDLDGPVVEELQGFKDDLASFQLELDGQKPEGHDTFHYHQVKVEDLIFPPEQLEGEEPPCVDDLGEEGLRFFECYRTTYCNFVSIGLELLNYFNKTFIWLASFCPGVAYALTAWGGFYLELQKPRYDFSRPWIYMQKAAKAMCEEMGQDLKPDTKEKFLLLLGFYLIFIGIEVTTGDVRNWRGLINQCKGLIESYKGPIALSREFDDSNDIKWLLSNFCFHDILSSHALTAGTTFPMSEYEAVVSPNMSYGIDPLHGIVSPVYLLFGHIGNSKAKLTRQWEEVQRQVSENHPKADALREEYYANVERVTAELTEKLNHCKPSATHLELLKNDAQAQKTHLALFELYVYACRIQLGMSIQQYPLCTLSQQQLLLKSLKILDELLVTRLKVALSLLILVCGILCCTDRDRIRMTSLFRMHSNQYEIGNLQRIEESVLEAWEMNPDGKLCLDWADLVADKNWHLYVG